jgi:amino acid adenylation domain-containing protein
LHDSLIHKAYLVSDKIAVIYNKEQFTYNQLSDKARRIANALVSSGLKRGDRVAIFMENTFDAVAAIYGTLIAGGVFMIINIQTKANKLEYIINDSEASFLISESHLQTVFFPLIEKCVSLKGFFYSGKSISTLKEAKIPYLSFTLLFQQFQPLPVPTHSIATDLAALIYTSGSTGKPKGVMMTHQSMVFAIESITQYLCLTSDDRIMNALPIAFDYGLYQVLMTIYLGATIILEKSFTYYAHVLNIISKYNITVFPAVPTMYVTLVEIHQRNKHCFQSVRIITNTAAALPADFQIPLQEIFPNAKIYRMYGLTECKRVCYLDPTLANQKPSSVGKAIPGTETFILNSKGERCAPNETGILHVRGPHIMRGYWKQPELSLQMLLPDTIPGNVILCTHDWFKMDEDGDLYFLGRSDDIIKTRGEKVSPVEVENVLYGIEGIREAAVIGEYDAVLGQAIVAYISLTDSSSLTEKVIQRECFSKLENFMVPKKIIFLKSLPKTDNGKIKKNELSHLKASST